MQESLVRFVGKYCGIPSNFLHMQEILPRFVGNSSNFLHLQEIYYVSLKPSGTYVWNVSFLPAQLEKLLFLFILEHV